MRVAHIFIPSLHAQLNTRLVIVANFIAGLLIGTLLGLAIAPVFRAWLLWKSVEEGRHSYQETPVEPTRVEQ
jgi:hypothetical protein